jgi:hypothetical protein
MAIVSCSARLTGDMQINNDVHTATTTFLFIAFLQAVFAKLIDAVWC